jgi:hypothetical protein
MSGASLCGAAAPFSVDSPDGEWHSNAVHRPLGTTNVTVEAMVLCSEKLPRYVVLSSPLGASGGESLPEFCRRLKASLAPGQDPTAEEIDAKKIGFEGRDLKFELAEGAYRYRCDLFVFLQEKTGWGILYFGAKDAPAPTRDPFLLFRPDAPVPEGVVGLTPYRVKEDPVTGFPISFEMEPNRQTGRIAHIRVKEVPPNSITEHEGVCVGDEILAINGRKTQDFLVGTGKKSEIGLIFLNREPGDEVTLEIISPGDKKSRKVTLRISKFSETLPPFFGRR